MDVSFISLTVLLPPLMNLFSSTVAILALIKPQFELPKDLVGDGGVVTEPSLHSRSIEKIANFVAQAGLRNHGVIESPILGPKGNREFLMYITSPNTACNASPCEDETV